MEVHYQIIENSFRICGANLQVKGKRKTKRYLFQQKVSKLWQQNVALDSPDVHPLHMCNKCRSLCANAHYLHGELRCNQCCVVWTPHTGDECMVCQNYPKSVGPGRRRKQKKLDINVPSTSLGGNGSTTKVAVKVKQSRFRQLQYIPSSWKMYANLLKGYPLKQGQYFSRNCCV